MAQLYYLRPLELSSRRFDSYKFVEVVNLFEHLEIKINKRTPLVLFEYLVRYPISDKSSRKLNTQKGDAAGGEQKSQVMRWELFLLFSPLF